MKKRMYAFGKPDMGRGEIRAVTRVLRSNWIAFGKESIAFEKELIAYTHAKDGVVVNSCTAALHLALVLHGVKKGDEIITTPLTFAATANTILHLGATPVFVDIHPDTLNINEDKIESAITKRTKGIVVVHFGGLPCDMTKINAIAKKHGLFVNEDAAHALGAKWNGKSIGDSPNMTCFSFYANKNLTSVDGGFLALPDGKKAERARSLRLHGLSGNAWNRFSDKHKLLFGVTEPGYKYNINDVHSAIGRVQLKRFSKNQSRRVAHARIYEEILRVVPGITLQPKYFGNTRIVHALHLYTIVLNPKYFSASREEIVMALRDAGIFAVVHYLPLHEHPHYRRKFHLKISDFPVATRVGENIISLPLLPQIGTREARLIAQTTRSVLQKHLKEKSSR